MIILFKYFANVKNCESFRGFGYIYIDDNDEFKFRLDLLEK